VGCGQGVMLSLILSAAAAYRRGEWPEGWPAPPDELTLIGIDTRVDVVQRARLALGPDATIVQGDATRTTVPRCDAVLMFDVLHLVPRPAQDALLHEVAEAIAPGGVVVLREADASGGWRFAAVRFGNRLMGIAQRQWGRRHHFRSGREWRDALVALGFDIDDSHVSDRTPFANVMLCATRRHPQGDAQSTGFAGAA